MEHVAQHDAEGLAREAVARELLQRRVEIGLESRRDAGEALERALGVERRIDRVAQPRGEDALHDHAADVPRVAARVLRGHPHAVRRAVEVDLVVAEVAAHCVEIGPGVRGRVAAQVDASRQAVAARGDRLDRKEIALRSDLAFERIRLSGAALVDQDDVALAADAGEGRRVKVRQARGRLSRPALQDEERLELARAQRGKDDDVQLDRASVLHAASLGHGDVECGGGRGGEEKRDHPSSAMMPSFQSL